MLYINNPPRNIVTSTGVIIPSDESVTFNRTGATQAIALYSAQGYKKAIFFYNIDSSTVTITPAAGTINGAANFALTGSGSGMFLVPDGISNWQVVGQSIAGDLTTAIAAAVAGALTQTITHGDTAHAPSGDAVFDALALKANVSTTKVYRALLTQSGTAAPVATVLENSLGGTVVWARTGVGVYTGTLASAFTANKTLPVNPSQFRYEDGNGAGYMITLTSANVITIESIDSSINADGILSGNPVNLLVYP